MSSLLPPRHQPAAGRRYPLTGHFDEGPAYGITRPHGADDWLIMMTLAGAARIDHAAGSFAAAAGDVILLMPDQAHGYYTHETTRRWEFLWAHFVPLPEWLPLLDFPVVGPGVRRVTLRDEAIFRAAQRAMLRVHRLAGRATLHQRQALAMTALQEVILWCREQHPDATMARLDARLRRAVEAVCDRLEHAWSVAEMAREANLSPSRFAHRFRAELGTSPQRFLDRQRIAVARQWLERTSLPVSEIARRLGFHEPTYFTRRFRHNVGMTPGAYRKRYA